jgi:hypothetical protein
MTRSDHTTRDDYALICVRETARELNDPRELYALQILLQKMQEKPGCITNPALLRETIAIIQTKLAPPAARPSVTKRKEG